MNNEIFTFNSLNSNNSVYNINKDILENNNIRKDDSREMTIINNSSMDMTYFKNDILKN